MNVLQRENELLLKCIESFISDFETDYVLDGKIVENPTVLLQTNYEVFKTVVETINKLKK